MAQPSRELLHLLADSSKEDLIFLEWMLSELKKAKKKHPKNALRLAALGEEHGEVCKAIHDEPWINVYKECAQLAATALRLAAYGDSSLVTDRLNNNLDCPFT